MILAVWSTVVSVAYAVLAVLAPQVATDATVAFIGLLLCPAIYRRWRGCD